ncbi:MAG TPA: class I tRNA ligase family protein [Acidimicrobiales bacterium]|nr:class I tRNA ligase family protein [Acidimicrobiales bacterium]
MIDARHFVTDPLPVTAGLGPTHLATLVAADALARWVRMAGGSSDVCSTTPAGDLGGRLALDTELVRQGFDPSTVDPSTLDAVASDFEDLRRDLVLGQLESLGVSPVVDGCRSDASRRAAHVAFVRLHEEGLISWEQMVVPACPSCATVVEGPDAVAGELEVERLRIELGGSPALVVSVTAPELLGGAAGVGVPVGHPAVGARVRVPLFDREVPVVAEPGCSEPHLLVPAHDPSARDLALLHGLPAPSVIGTDGAILGDGMLGGLQRFAARAAARALLEAEGVVVEVTRGTEDVERCRRCGSVTVPILGWHWALHIEGLVVAAADMVRHAALRFLPADARDVMLDAGATMQPWCLDRTVPGGVRLPVATCLECLRMSVGLPETMGTSCAKCLGELVPSRETLDARFTSALWPLVRLGWPAAGTATSEREASATVAVVARDSVGEWALPSLALAIRLAGFVPFANVVVHPPEPPMVGEAPFDASDARALRLALLAGTDLDTAEAAVAALDDGAGAPDGDLVAAVAAAVEALETGGPGLAGGLVVAALSGGVAPRDAASVRELVRPFLGDVA